MRGACRDLHGRGLLTDRDGATGLTADGAAAVDALAASRRDALNELAAEWRPDQHPELAAAIERLSDDLALSETAPRTR